jgi:endonuclease IV
LQPPPHLGRNVAVAKPELDRSHLHAMREAISMHSEAIKPELDRSHLHAMREAISMQSEAIKPELDRSHLHAMREAISMQSEALRGNQREGSSPLCTCMR